jgi:alpha-tubulin suppressor-like RCC1 family protein
VKIAQVSAAEFHTCARDTSGGIWCWGDNAVGQLGVDVPESKTPMQVPMVLGTAPVAATSLALGGKHSCAVGNHQVFCWGENGDGQCGVAPSPGNDDVKKPTAVADLDGVDEVAPGDEFTCALRDDRSVFCWGANAQGELGNGTRLPSATPLKVGLPSVAHLSAGDEHACGAKDDGSVWCWGYGQSGSVGSGVKDDKLLPVAVGMSAKKVYSSGQAFHACAVTADGTLKCWGANDTQQVGVPGAGDSVLSPEAVDLVTVSQVGIGGKHSCALTFDGALWCWGSNEAGQLGTGSAGASVPTPQRIPFACP